MKLCLVLCLVLIANSVYCKMTNRGYSGEFLKAYTEPRQHSMMIPVIIYFDKALTDLLVKEGKMKTREQGKEISINILEEAAHLLGHPSLNHSVHFDLKGVVFLENKFIKLDDNANKYFTKFCTWQGEQKRKKNNWWYSILLTGMDIFSINNKGEEKDIVGESYVRGICHKNFSCAILEWQWHPMEIGKILAHEIGHSLGMEHDGLPHNKCKPVGNIMASSYDPRHLPKTWSQCNKQDLERFLLSSENVCFPNVNIQQNKKMKRYFPTRKLGAMDVELRGRKPPASIRRRSEDINYLSQGE